MYVYVIKFESKPHLIKIGKSATPVKRSTTLVKSHGAVVYSGHYKIGSSYGDVEKYLHSTYSEYREKVDGDGGTEFFSDSIYEDVSSYLNKYKSKGCLMLDEEFIQAQLKIERKRYYNLIGRLLGYGVSELHTGDWYSGYMGMHDITRINSCYEMGFTPDEVHRKYVAGGGDSFFKRGFTTIKRVEIAYKLSAEGTKKVRELESLLREAQKDNAILPH